VNPIDHAGRTTSPFVEAAENADAVDEYDLSEVPTFDDVATGAVPVRQVRVRAVPDLPAPVGVAGVLDATPLPRLVTPRHARAMRPSATVRGILFAITAAVLCDTALVMGMLAGLEAVKGGVQ
jgi:hypothetical protein